MFWELPWKKLWKTLHLEDSPCKGSMVIKVAQGVHQSKVEMGVPHFELPLATACLESLAFQIFFAQAPERIRCIMALFKQGSFCLVRHMLLRQIADSMVFFLYLCSAQSSPR